MGCCSCLSRPTTKDAYRLSVASLFFTLLATYMGLWLYAETGSSLCLVFGLENIVDFLSSVVVTWRFFAPLSLDDTLEQKLQRREERASMAISFIMILLGFLVISGAIDDAQRGPEEAYEYGAIWFLCFLSFLVFTILTSLKLKYAKKMNCDSLYKDGVCSLIGTTLALAIMINTILAIRFPVLWWLDPFTAFVAGMIALGLGCKAVYEATGKGIPIFTKSWWSQGSDDTTIDDQGITSNGSKELDIEVVDLPNGGSADDLHLDDKQIV